ncbi:MAG: SOS response-associated peptidase [Opitutales bacterium]|jgi:putative SOS response-associated peptidase YedK|nr:SOS response-associated peptidase [Opitutales bacterium]
MCGRFSLVVPERFFSKVYLFKTLPEMHPDYNIPPGVDILAVRNGIKSSQPEITRLRWGLIPSWAKDPKVGNQMINARSETVAEKPSFKSAFKSRRCLIPADGFYEWKREGKTRIPYHIHLRDREPFAMAGLWESWRDPEGGVLESCTILTTTPNKVMEPLHDRMPVIVPESEREEWLNISTPRDRLKKLAVPFPEDHMAAYPVSSIVNSPRNNGPECLEKQEILSQGELF